MESYSAFFPKDNVKSLLGIKGWKGDIAAAAVMSIIGLNRVNRTFRPLNGLKNIEFADAAIKEVGVSPVIDSKDLERIPAKGPVIICSNHPYGCIDGIMMLSAVGKVRPDVRIMTNFILSQIPCLAESFISVDPFAKGKSISVSGVRAALNHLAQGGALVLFPAGEVSSDRNPDRVVRDIEWERGAMRLIAKSGAPVVPAFFSGCNSKLFHRLGAINPYFRTMRLPWELLNKRGKRIRLKFGNPAKPLELSAYNTPEELAAYLRNRSYALEGFIYREEHPVPVKSAAEIEKHIDREILKAELAGIEDKLLYRSGDYACYLTRYEDIPNIIKEIGVCREETFRKNGEGTGKSIDLDEYDTYYLHLHLWKEDSCELVGAYRVGLGNEIIERGGVKAFYSDLFFHFKDEFAPVLARSIELGRSFIVEQFQVVPNALKMLLNNGVGRLEQLYPDMRNFIGPASISSDFPPLFGSLLVEYLKQTGLDRRYCDMVRPDIPFVPQFHNVDISAIKFKEMSLDQFDKVLGRMSNKECRIPPLVRAYVRNKCSFIGFNVDPGFNYCIDVLLMVEINQDKK